MSIKRVVIKIGSSLLANKEGIDASYLKSLVDTIALLRKENKEVLIVTSGAIACGLKHTKFRKKPNKLNNLQAIAAIGQGILMAQYHRYFSRYDIPIGQILLTWEDFEDRIRYLNATNTISALLEQKAIPIINENDTVSTEEIEFGDNDKLSALVAALISADLLLILSNVDGFFGPKGRIPLITEISNDLKKLCSGKHCDTTKGGMLSKLDAAKIAMDSGIKAIIGNGKDPKTILKLISQEEPILGTTFLPKSLLVAKKRWIAFSRKPKGKIIVDGGAKTALVENKKSLLAPGVISIEGNFQEGDCVSIIDQSHKEFARGLVNCSSDELQKTKGKKYIVEIIHRDNMVIL